MDSEQIRLAYTSPQWREAAEAVRVGLGVTVAIVDPSAGTLATSGPTPLCDLFCRDLGGPGFACVATRGNAGDRDAPLRGQCEGGMPCVVAPVRAEGRVACYALVTGYVHSARDRRRVLQRLLASGVTEAAARVAADELPVLSPDKAGALTSLVASRAALTLRELLDERRREGSRRSLDLLSDVAHDLNLGSRTYDNIPEGALTTVMRLTSGVCARLTLSRSPGTSEVVAEAGECAVLPPFSEAGGRVLASGRSVVVTGASADGVQVTSLAVPLGRGGACAGVLEVAKAGEARMGADDIRLVELFAEIVSAMLENAAAFKDANTKLIELIQVNEVAKALNATIEYARLAELAVQVLVKTLDFRIGGFVVDCFGSRRGRVAFSEDVAHADIESVVADATGVAAANALAGVTVVPQLASLTGDDAGAGEWSVLSCEISFRNIRAGELFVASRGAGAFRAQDERVLQALAAHLSTALENATLYERLNDESRRTMAALSALADAHEYRRDGHTGRVMDYALALGREMGLPVERLEILRFAGLLHDVGKAGVAEEILLKPSSLTSDEMERVRRHSELGASILEQLEFLEELTPIVRHHHEAFDGSGYPDALAGAAIPLEARILAVADAYESMTSRSPHRKGLAASTARLELQRCAGGQFDPRVVEAFLRVLDDRAFVAAAGLLAHDGPTDGPRLPA